MNVNTVAISGNLTRDPELKPVGETHVCELGVAVNERVKKNGEWEDYANYFDVVIWGKSAEAAAKFLSKGSRVALQGRLKQDRWKNEADENRSKVRIVVDRIEFPPKGDGSSAPSESTGSDGLPF